VGIQKRFFKTKGECEVTFECNAPDAESAALVCEANGWQPIAMARKRSGPFRARLRLPKGGEYQFRYLVDGRDWINDEAADAYRPNEYGGENGVVSTLGA